MTENITRIFGVHISLPHVHLNLFVFGKDNAYENHNSACAECAGSGFCDDSERCFKDCDAALLVFLTANHSQVVASLRHVQLL